MISEIDYDFLVEKSLKNVVKDALKIAEAQGLPGNHHFYISFKTNHPETEVSGILKSQYPEEMTIVLQHQYNNLHVDEAYFSVELQFGGLAQKLKIPFDAVSYFADPSTRFGLSFNTDDDEQKVQELLEDKVEEAKDTTPATIVSINDFRKKKK